MEGEQTFWVVEAALVVGEYEQIFHHVIPEAIDGDEAFDKVEAYFKDYYGEGNLDDHEDGSDWYSYNCGEVAVRVFSIEQRTIGEIMQRLSI